MGNKKNRMSDAETAMDIGYDKHRDGKFPDCRFCRYRVPGSRGIRCRYKHCPYRKRLDKDRRDRGW